MNYWYRNIGGRYHLACLDWVRSGRAVCGADIRHPAFTTHESDWPGNTYCKHCLRKGV